MLTGENIYSIRRKIMIDKKIKELLGFYNSGLGLYKERKFKGALKEFKKALELKPGDGPSKLYIERCEILIKEPPPPDWDGVFTMTSK